MKYGIIFDNLAIIIELDIISEVINKKKEFFLIRNWRNKFNGELIAKNFLIASKEIFLNNLNYFDNELTGIKKLIWELEINKIKNDIIELPFYPKVSVILPSYNSKKTINYAIKSIIVQKYKNIELIIIDDCSNDGSYEEILQIKEQYENKISNFKVYRNTENKGVYFSRNFGIQNSTGDIIAMQDSDDISDKFRLSISVLELSINNVEFILSNGVKICNSDRLSPISVAMASIVVKRTFYDKYGYYDEDTRHSGDLEILDRAYYMKYGKYENDNFWYWLNYTTYLEDFYYHIYRNLYYIGENDNGITKHNKLEERMLYLLGKRKIMKNKM